MVVVVPGAPLISGNAVKIVSVDPYTAYELYDPETSKLLTASFNNVLTYCNYENSPINCTVSFAPPSLSVPRLRKVQLTVSGPDQSILIYPLEFPIRHKSYAFTSYVAVIKPG